MQDIHSIQYADSAPYPPVQVKEKNFTYGKWMLDNIGGLQSEMSAVSLYFYNSLLTDASYSDLSFIFHKISMVEMKHLEIFGKLALLLGEDPKLWSQMRQKRAYWCPGYNHYPIPLPSMMENALTGELATVSKYETQSTCIQDPYIIANLKRIILDEKRHIEIFRQIIKEHHLPCNVLE